MLRNMRSGNREAGTALVEFAISLLAFLALLFGISDVGRAAYAYDWVSNAARLGTRFAMVRGKTCTVLSGGCPAAASDVSNYVTNANGNGVDTTGIDPSQLTVTTVCFAQGAVTHTSPPCAAQGYVQVTVQYTFKFVSSASPLTWSMQSSSEQLVQN